MALRENILYGLSAVSNMLATSPNKLYKIYVYKHVMDKKVWELVKLARKYKIHINVHDRHFFNKYNRFNHQGIVGYYSQYEYRELSEFYEFLEAREQNEFPDILFIDSINDPHNLGAIIRSAYLLDCKWILVPQKNTSPIIDTVIRASNNATFDCEIVKMKKDYRYFCDELKERFGYTIIALDNYGEHLIDDLVAPKGTPYMLIVGNDEGVNSTLLRKSNYTARFNIFNTDTVDTFNTSSSTSIALYQLKHNKRAAEILSTLGMATPGVETEKPKRGRKKKE